MCRSSGAMSTQRKRCSSIKAAKLSGCSRLRPTYSSRLMARTPAKLIWPRRCIAASSRYMPMGVFPVAKPKTAPGRTRAASHSAALRSSSCSDSKICTSIAMASLPSHSHSVVASVDVEHLAGDPRGEIREQEERRFTHLFLRHVAPERGALRVELEHSGKARHSSRRDRVDRPGGNGVDPNSLGAKVAGQVPHRGLQSRLGDAHDVVI